MEDWKRADSQSEVKVNMRDAWFALQAAANGVSEYRGERQITSRVACDVHWYIHVHSLNELNLNTSHKHPLPH